MNRYKSFLFVIGIVALLGTYANVSGAAAANCFAEGSADRTIRVLLVGNSLINGVQSKLKTLLT